MLEWLGRIDAAVFQSVTALRTPALDVLMLAASEIGLLGAVWVGLGILATALRPSRLPGLVQLVLALCLAGSFTSWVIKPLAARDRPFTSAEVQLLGTRPETASFTSGH